MFLLVPAYPGSPGQRAVKRLCPFIVGVEVLNFETMNTLPRPPSDDLRKNPMRCVDFPTHPIHLSFV